MFNFIFCMDTRWKILLDKNIFILVTAFFRTFFADPGNYRLVFWYFFLVSFWIFIKYQIRL